MLQIDKANRTAIPLALKTCLYNRQMKNNTSHQLFHIDFVCFPSIKPTDSIMPRSIDTTSSTQFVMITIAELQTFTKLNASARVIECYIALRSFMWNGKSAFPSLKAIAERMGLDNKTYKQTVSTALKWLEDHGLIQRNKRTSKERFVLTSPNERLADALTNKPDKVSESTNRRRSNNLNRSITPNPQRGRQRNRRFSPHEKRHRKWERKCEQAKKEQARREQQAKQSKAENLTFWQEQHLEAQDSIISLNGTNKHHEKMALLLARFNFETFPDLWHYEPATIEEIGLQRDRVAQELMRGTLAKVPFNIPFTFGTSVSTIHKWFIDKTR
jgi:DNA-binding MarR family transcriptional regulator